MKKMLKIIPLILILAVISAGCAGFIKNSYVTLATSQDLYLQARSAARDLYAQGLIDEETRIEINDAANIYKRAHNVAVRALEVYAVTKDADAKDQARVAIAEAALRWLDVAKLINAISPGLVPNSLTGG
jgi:hypothetical protein